MAKVLGRAEDGPESVEIYSLTWWQSRSSEELRDIINRGFAGGDAFGGALAESERRVREAARLKEQAYADPIEHAWRIKFAALSAGIVALFAVLTLAAWWLLSI